MLFIHNDNLLQSLLFTNLRYLFFCIACFIALSSYRSLWAQSSSENHEFNTLVENIYDLLLQGHSADDIIEMLDDEQENPYNVQKLVTYIHDQLNGNKSKGAITKVISSNKESEKYYSRKNFLTNVKICYFVLKIVAVIVAIIVVCNLLSSWFPGMFGFLPGLPKPKNQSNADVDKKSDTSESGTSESKHNEETPLACSESESHEKSSQPSLEVLGPCVEMDSFDSKKYADIIAQLEYAKRENYIPANGVFDVIGADKEQVDTHSLFYKMRLTEQIAFVKRNGYIK